MSNVDNTTLWSDNPKKFDEVTKDIEFEGQCDFVREPGQIFMRTARRIPVEQIKQLSAQNPDITFYATHSFDHDLHGKTYNLEYKNGEYQVTKVEPAYLMPVMDKIRKKVSCYDELEEKLLSVFKRLDVEVTDSEGDKDLDFADAEVTVTVEHGGYKMKATKCENMVYDVQVFQAKKVESTQWEKISGEDNPIGPAFLSKKSPLDEEPF